MSRAARVIKVADIKSQRREAGGGGGEREIRRGVVFGGEGNWVNGIHAEYYRVVGGTPPHTHNMFSDVSAAPILNCVYLCNVLLLL